MDEQEARLSRNRCARLDADHLDATRCAKDQDVSATTAVLLSYCSTRVPTRIPSTHDIRFPFSISLTVARHPKAWDKNPTNGNDIENDRRYPPPSPPPSSAPAICCTAARSGEQKKAGHGMKDGAYLTREHGVLGRLRPLPQDHREVLVEGRGDVLLGLE